MLESIQHRIVVIQPTRLGADPQRAILVRGEGGNGVVAQRPGLAADVFIDLEAVAIEAVQAVLGADPKETGTVLRHRQRCGLREAVARAVVAETHVDDARNGTGRTADAQQHGGKCRRAYPWKPPARHGAQATRGNPALQAPSPGCW